MSNQNDKILSGSGSEVDRYGSHFGVGDGGLDRIKQAAMTKGLGAEQEVHSGHFSLDSQAVKQATDAALKTQGLGAEQEVHAGHFGLGHDGKERVKKLLNTQGVGAEQVSN